MRLRMNPLLVAAAMIGSMDTAPSAPTCPHCGQRVGASLDDQHRHATARCAAQTPEAPNRARDFLDRQVADARERRRQYERQMRERQAENQAAAIKRLENAIAKRERKASRNKSQSPTEPR